MVEVSRTGWSIAKMFISLYSQLLLISKKTITEKEKNRPTVEHIYSRIMQLQKLKGLAKAEKRVSYNSNVHNCVLKVRLNSTTPACNMFKLDIINS
jgi:hypothetical protein